MNTGGSGTGEGSKVNMNDQMVMNQQRNRSRSNSPKSRPQNGIADMIKRAQSQFKNDKAFKSLMGNEEQKISSGYGQDTSQRLRNS